jgi:arylmalonate decarboxylase
MPRSSSPLIGMIVPPASGEVPPEGAILYPDIRFVAMGLGLRQISPTGFDEVVATIVAKAELLAADGAQAISVMGTSLTFYQGANANNALITAVAAATGLPTTTMSSAVVRGLKALGVGRVALATAYIDDLNTRLTTFLAANDITVAGIEGLAMTDMNAVKHVPPARLITLAERAFAHDPSAEGILLSCGGLLTLDVIDPVEQRLGIPVVASSPAGFWDAVQVAGLDAACPGYGRLFQAPPLGSQPKAARSVGRQ